MENNVNNTKQIDENAQQHNMSYDEVDLRELFNVIWHGKWKIISIIALFAVMSVAYAISQPNVYKSEALLAPAEEKQAGSLGGQLGGLASFAGLNLGSGGGVDKTQMAIEVLKSRQFIGEFIQKHGILPDLMAAESWNRETNTINYDQALYNREQSKWVHKAETFNATQPSMQKAYKKFSKIINANINKETGMATISAEHVSPIVAQQWVNWLVQNINAEMKARDVQEATRSTTFLIDQLEQTKIADIRTMLYKMIETQTKTIMFANVRDEYIFKTIDPAIAPEQKFKPKRALICVLGVLVGLTVGVMLVLLRYYVKKSY